MSATATHATHSAQRTTWQIDPSHLEVGFAVRHLMISTVRGRFTGVAGTVTLENEDFATAQVDVTIDVNTIDTREPKRDAHLRSADFFDVAEFPTMTFTSRRVEHVEHAEHGAHGHYRLIGDLTIRDVTREVTLEVVSEGRVRDPWGGDRAGFSAKAVIDRTDFGLTWNVMLEAGGMTVGNEVKLSFEVELIRQAASQ